MSIIKGQNLRIMIGQSGSEKCIAGATSCTIHIAANLEEASTKDDTASWSNQEVTGKSWDGSADALVIVDSADTTGVQAFDVVSMVGTKVTVKFQQTEGEKNRSAVVSGKVLSGTAIINDLSINAGNKSNATYSIQFTGCGALS